jgi:hypothetical protein
VRHRASDLSPAFDTASYGRGFAYAEPKRDRPPAEDTRSHSRGLPVQRQPVRASAVDTGSYSRGFPAHIEPELICPSAGDSGSYPVYVEPDPIRSPFVDTGSYSRGFPASVEPAPVRGRGRPLAVAGTAAVALLGAALLITGATQVVQRDQVTGLPLPQP